MIVHYGAPSTPDGGRHGTPFAPPNDRPTQGETIERIGRLLGAPHRVRVSVLADGVVTRLKIEVDGKLVAEVSGDRSLVIETEIGGG